MAGAGPRSAAGTAPSSSSRHGFLPLRTLRQTCTIYGALTPLPRNMPAPANCYLGHVIWYLIRATIHTPVALQTCYIHRLGAGGLPTSPKYDIPVQNRTCNTFLPEELAHDMAWLLPTALVAWWRMGIPLGGATVPGRFQPADIAAVSTAAHLLSVGVEGSESTQTNAAYANITVTIRRHT